jgi:hypothetical protein
MLFSYNGNYWLKDNAATGPRPAPAHRPGDITTSRMRAIPLLYLSTFIRFQFSRRLAAPAPVSGWT